MQWQALAIARDAVLKCDGWGRLFESKRNGEAGRRHCNTRTWLSLLCSASWLCYSYSYYHTGTADGSGIAIAIPSLPLHLNYAISSAIAIAAEWLALPLRKGRRISRESYDTK